MNINLAMPFGKGCSPPQNPNLSFYSMHSEDLLFDGVDKIEICCQSGFRAVGGEWTISRNALTTPFAEGVLDGFCSNRFVVEVPTKGLYPGFYDLRVEIQIGNGETLEGVCVFGWNVEDMESDGHRPADFTEFWQKAKDEIAAVDLDSRAESEVRIFTNDQVDAYNLKCAALPASYDPNGIIHDKVESQKVSFAGPDNGRVYGFLAKPEGNGPFPAMLVLPGAGFNARSRPLEHARHGFLALDIQVHGQDVCLDDYPSIDGHGVNEDYSAPENYYYYHVHQRVLQAINYLVSRPDVDSDNIVVLGGSQGGRLTTVAAGIDSRIKAAISCIGHFGNQPYFKWSQECNEKKDDGMAQAGTPVELDQQYSCFAYYDPMNFAADVQCPVIMNAGLIDPISQASHVFGVYNNLGTDDKEIIALPGLGHDWCPEFDRRAWRWLEKYIEYKK